jgi:molybdate/tungstate transport system substrate-binding protein
MERRKILALGIAMAVIACVSVTSFYTPFVEEAEAQEGKTLKIFHAGSLAVPLEEAESQFEAIHPNVDVRRESMGSIAAVRQITDVGKRGEVLASADYTLIPSMMYPEYANWTVRFATNDLVLAYNPEKSKYGDEITPDNWYDILRRDSVIFAFSNPNLDPCGYRAVMVFQLAELYYGDKKIFDDFILNNTAITISEEEDGTYLIKTPEDMKPNRDKVSIRPKSVELVALVEAGGLDYAFEYRSIAVQHNLAFVDLPEPIDLSRVEYADVYKKVKLETVDGKTKTGKPIVYGITVPKNAENPELGLEFVKFVIGDAGQKIFADRGQQPIVPPEGSGLIPAELKPSIKPILTLATGSPYELGVIGALNKPFEEKYKCKVEVTKAGSGKSLDLGREGKVDLVMVHAPKAEEEFVADGYGLNRTYVMYNDFVIVGPKSDPAGIRGMTNVAEGYKKIAETKSLFFSQGDNSGTHKKEMSIWESGGITPEGDWYKVTHAFMAATLEIANEKQGYFMTDRSTYITLKRDISLDILVEGDPVLVNHYHAIAVNQVKHPTVNYELAKKFIDYVSSPEGQTIIRDFGKEEFGEPLYYVAVEPTPSPTVMPTSAQTPTPMPSPSPTQAPTPGFEVVFVVAALVAVTYILLRRRKK